MTDWAIPQQAKLKYTQLFNLHDRSRSGFLSGLQCRDILLQSGLHRNVLAEIWNLSDIDGDGQLTREEFILAMHLTNQVRSGQNLPTELPHDLIPPSYRRARSISATSVNSVTSANSSVSGGNSNNNNNNQDDQVAASSQKSSESVATATTTALGSILNTNSFEDKRRENFEKGRAELERRRLKIIEQQSSIIREQLEASKKQVAEAKAKIDSMRSDRDTKMGLITSLEAQLKTVQDRRTYLQQEELNLIAIAKDLNLVNLAQAELDELATQTKQQTINQMKEQLGQFSEERDKKQRELTDITNRLESSEKDLKDVSQKVKVIYDAYKEKIAKARIVREEIINENRSKTVDLDSVWGADTGFGTQSSPIQLTDPIPDILKDDPWAAAKPEIDSSKAFRFEDTQNSMTGSSFSQAFGDLKSGNGVKAESSKQSQTTIRSYRALYAFEARNLDELTINPGDTIKGSGEVCEPGWLSGRIGTRTGLFPEAYVEPLEDEPEDTTNFTSLDTSSSTQNQNQLIESMQKSLTIIPANKYRVLYAFEARNPDELSIEPGDVVTEIEGAHEPEWLCGELNGQRGLFPEAYVENMPEEQTSQSQQENNQPGKSRSKKAEVATVIANYRALGQEQLSLEKGQLVLIRRKIDSGWWEGEIQVKESELRSSNELDYLIRELIESELDYVNDLKLCKIAYIVPLSKSFDVSNIFNCWNQLIDVHESRLDTISGSSVMDKSVLLSSFLDLLNSSTNLYINFCSRQTESSKNFDAKLMSDMRFRQLVNECQRNLHKTIEKSRSSSSPSAPGSSTTTSSIGNWYCRTMSNVKLPLTNFIIKPMQRITKYSLLFTKMLETIIKMAPYDQQIFNLATEVKCAALELCEQVNDACRRKEDTEQNMRKLAWAQSHIKLSLNHDSSLDLAFAADEQQQQVLDSKYNVETNITFGSETNCLGARQLIKAGCVSKLRSGRELVLFLFNDIVLLTQVRGGSILKVEDIFRSTKAQQTYYKIYRAPIMVENLRLVSVSKNRRQSWVEKQSITVSFSDQSNGTLYELLALSAAEKATWIEELERASDEARNARAIYEERNSLRSTKRLDVSDCRGRLFITVLEANMSCISSPSSYSVDSSAEFSDTNSLKTYSNSIKRHTPIGPLVSVQIQLRTKDSFDLLRTRQENIPISDVFRTSPKPFTMSHKFSSPTSNIIYEDQRPAKSDYAIEYEDYECTQFLVPRTTTTCGEGVDILDVILMNVSNYSPNRIVARRRVRLDSLIAGYQTKPSEAANQQESYLRSDRPSDFVFKLKPVDLSIVDRPRRISFLDRPSSSSPAHSAKHILQEPDQSFEIKLRLHLQLFCDNEDG